MHKSKKGYSIVEIIIVITIIGILATIGYLVYNGLQRDTRSKTKATQIAAISEALEKYHEENGEYLSCEDMASDTAGDLLGIDQSFFSMPGSNKLNSFTDGCELPDDDDFDSFFYDGEGSCSLRPNEPCYEFGLGYYDEEDYEKDDDEYIDDDEEDKDDNPIKVISKEIIPSEEIGKYLDCGAKVGQPGYIPVPGSKTYGTKSFCVMKYEAKYTDDGANRDSMKAVSAAQGFQLWRSQGPGTPSLDTQSDAVKYAKTACDGCRLISEAQWLTLAQNVMRNGYNWTGEKAGVGSLYFGHTAWKKDCVDDASEDDSEERYGLPTSWNDTSDITMNRRTFKITNGTTDNNIIWDLSGNLGEWTSDGTGHISDFVDLNGEEVSNLVAPITAYGLSSRNKLKVNPLPVYGVPELKQWPDPSTVELGYYLGQLSTWNEDNPENPKIRYFVRGRRKIYDLELVAYSPYEYKEYVGFRSVK